MNRIDTLINRVRNRMAFDQFLQALGQAVLIAAAGVLVYVLLRQFARVRLPAEGIWLAALGCGALIYAAWIALKRRPAAMPAAVAIDQRLGLHEKFSTALHVRDQADPFDRAVVLDAERAAATADLSNRFPLRYPRALTPALIVAVVCAGLLLFVQPRDLLAGNETPGPMKPEDPKAREQAQQVARKAIAAIEMAPPAVADKESIRLAKAELRELAARKDFDPAVVNRKALSTLQDVQQAIKEQVEKNQKYTDAKENLKHLGTLQPDAGDKGAIADAQRELANGNFEEAMARIDQAVNAFDQLAEEQKQQAAAQMRKLADQLQKLADNPRQQQRTEQQLRQMGLNQQQVSQAKQALQQAAQGNPQAQQQVQQLARQAMQQMNNGQGATQQQQQQVQQMVQQLQGQANSQQQAKQLQQAAEKMSQCMGGGSGQSQSKSGSQQASAQNKGQSGQSGQQGQGSQQGQAGSQGGQQSGGGQSAQQQLASAAQEMKQQLQQMQASAQAAQQASAAQQAAQAAASAAQGGQNVSGGASGVGQEHAPGERGITPVPFQTRTELTHINNDPNGRIIAATLVKADVLKGDSKATLQDVARATLQNQTDEADTERVGRAAQGVVRDYFDALADEK